jgi:hypothetical protein
MDVKAEGFGAHSQFMKAYNNAGTNMTDKTFEEAAKEATKTFAQRSAAIDLYPELGDGFGSCVSNMATNRATEC